MSTENFLEVTTENSMVTIAKSSIALVEQKKDGIGSVIILKEKSGENSQITIHATMDYNQIVSELHKFEKISPTV